ncbi:MAG: hypothetical protein CMM94_02500 [Rickettsiales bacterium]|nr:hypothetical protein [Rickettsiales bacterium]
MSSSKNIGLSPQQPPSGALSDAPVQAAEPTNASHDFDWSRSISLDYDRASPPPTTGGERTFNAVDWWGFGWIGNTVASIFMADWMNNKGGQPIRNKVAEKMADTPVFKLLGDEAKAISGARSFINIAFLMSGGFIVMLPIKFFEDHKKWWVTKFDDIGLSFNRLIGRGEQSENDQKLMESRHEYLDHEPKQTWGTVIGSRIVTILPVFALHFSLSGERNLLSGMGFKGLDHEYGEFNSKAYEWLKERRVFGIQGKMERAEAAMGSEALKLQEKFAAESKQYELPGAEAGHGPGEQRMREFVGNTIIDLSYSLGIASATFFASRVLAQRHEDKNRAQEETEATPKPKTKGFSSVHVAMDAQAAPSDIPSTLVSDAQQAQRVSEPSLQRNELQ